MRHSISEGMEMGWGRLCSRERVRNMGLSMAKGSRLPQGQRDWEGTYLSFLSLILPEGLRLVLTPAFCIPDLL